MCAIFRSLMYITAINIWRNGSGRRPSPCRLVVSHCYTRWLLYMQPDSVLRGVRHIPQIWYTRKNEINCCMENSSRRSSKKKTRVSNGMIRMHGKGKLDRGATPSCCFLCLAPSELVFSDIFPMLFVPPTLYGVRVIVVVVVVVLVVVECSNSYEYTSSSSP